MRWFPLPLGVAAFYEVLELDEAGAHFFGGATAIRTC